MPNLKKPDKWTKKALPGSRARGVKTENKALMQNSIPSLEEPGMDWGGGKGIKYVLSLIFPDLPINTEVGKTEPSLRRREGKYQKDPDPRNTE